MNAPRAAFAYRTSADLPEFDGEAAAWASEEVTLEVVVAPGLLADTTHAAAVWDSGSATAACAAPRLTPTLSEGCTSESCVVLGDGHDSIVVSSDESRFEEGVAAVTEVSYRQRPSGLSGWLIVEADVWVNGPLIARRGLDRSRVLAHELGHLLGLLHSEVGTAGAMRDWPLLHPLYTEASIAEPASDDLAGLCFLYPSCVETCGAGERCEGGACTPACLCADATRCGAEGECVERPVGRHGDACTSAEECATGLCARAGHCAERCDGGRCGDRHSCMGGVCESSASTFGETCTTGSQCVTGVCLTRDGQSVCTRDCAGECPPGSSCGSVDDRDVCLPSSGGCSTGGAGSGWWCLMFLVVGSRWRRRVR